MALSLVRRIASGLAIVLGVVALTFVLLQLAPGDPVLRLLGPTATPEQIETQRTALGLDRPLPMQFAGWLRRFVTGDWGTSIAAGRPVAELIGDAWPATVLLVGTSLTLSYLLGIAIGAFQASRGGSAADTAVSLATVTLFAMPGYWLALMLVMLFTYRFGALPAFGAAGLDADFLSGRDQVIDRLRHLALPLLTLTLLGLAGTARYVRGAMLDVLDEQHVVTAMAKGLSRGTVLRRHVLRNALVPVVTLLGLSLPALFSGAVFVEAVFAWPGVGGVLVGAVQARDYPVILAATAVSALLVVIGNALADLLVAWVDPRAREAARL